jgi:hypothetical protein
MRLHQPRIGSSSLTVRRAAAALAVMVSVVGAADSVGASQASECERKIAAVTSATSGIPKAIGAAIGRGVENASALARFHRPDAALARLDAIVALLDSRRGERVPDGARAQLIKSVSALRGCVAALQPVPLSLLTIRVADEAGRSAGTGVYLEAEGISIGRTGGDGTLQANVPSGSVRLNATKYPGSIGGAVVNIEPGTAGEISVTLADGKEPSEDSELLLEQAPDGILPANPPFLTLKFMQDDAAVRMESIEQIDISDDAHSPGQSVTELFRIVDDSISASNPSVAYGRLADRVESGRSLRLVASAIDTEGRRHYGAVSFHIGQFKLAARLAPPPSNTSLPVANIAVRISLIGTDVVLKRTSDRQGRFEIEGLPDTTAVFDAHAVASGDHYYIDATLSMCADRSVTLVLRNVKDLVAGVRGLILEPGTVQCPTASRR